MSNAQADVRVGTGTHLSGNGLQTDRVDGELNNCNHAVDVGNNTSQVRLDEVTVVIDAVSPWWEICQHCGRNAIDDIGIDRHGVARANGHAESICELRLLNAGASNIECLAWVTAELLQSKAGGLSLATE